MILDKRVF